MLNIEIKLNNRKLLFTHDYREYSRFLRVNRLFTLYFAGLIECMQPNNRNFVSTRDFCEYSAIFQRLFVWIQSEYSRKMRVLAKFRLFGYIHSNSHQKIAEILAKIASTRALSFLCRSKAILPLLSYVCPWKFMITNLITVTLIKCSD